MDDFVISNLYESRNEWCSRLVGVFTPLVTEGIRSIFNEAWKMCQDTDEATKYLMTFQNLLSRVPKWNSVIVEEERKRIIERWKEPIPQFLIEVKGRPALFHRKLRRGKRLHVLLVSIYFD